MDVNVEPHNGSVDGGDDGRALVGPSNGGPGGKAGGQERLEPACAIKMLVPSGSAGCLIGKGMRVQQLESRPPNHAWKGRSPPRPPLYA